MKKKVIFLLLTTTVLTSALVGCGRNKKDNANDNNVAVTETEQITEEDMGTESVVSTEDASSQLQLGNAVEIPKGWDGHLAETDAHAQLEQVIADYCGIAQEEYNNVRYYYNYVDLNGDSKNEILALVLGQAVTGMDGNVLLWIEDAENGNITKESVKQSFKHVGSPVYISNHMTEGHRDLIVVKNDSTIGVSVAGQNGDAVVDPRSVDSDTTQENATKQGTATTEGTVQNAGEQTTIDQNTAEVGTTEGVGTDTAHATPKYILLVWTGEKYQELEEGTVLDRLDTHEGTAILTNNMESDYANDNYHFLGEAMK